MNNRIIKEIFSRLFVIAIQNKINLSSFIFFLERSEFIKKIENKTYDDYFNKPLEDIFSDITGNKIYKDESYGILNDAYWSGYMYFDLFIKTNKPFSYIFLKLPLDKLLDMYPIYHEMDFSNLYEQFVYLEKRKTILRLLCEKHNTSLPKLSETIKIPLSTLSKYNKSDEYLYNASFQNIIKISNFFNTPITLFLRSVD